MRVVGKHALLGISDMTDIFRTSRFLRRFQRTGVRTINNDYFNLLREYQFNDFDDIGKQQLHNQPNLEHIFKLAEKHIFRLGICLITWEKWSGPIFVSINLCYIGHVNIVFTRSKKLLKWCVFLKSILQVCKVYL